MTMGRFTGGHLFEKGKSGNPGGRPKGNPAVRKLLNEHSEEAAQRVIDLLRSENEKVALMAAQEILNRTEGKATEFVKMNVSGHLNTRAQLRDIFKEHLSHEQDDTESDGDNGGASEQGEN